MTAREHAPISPYATVSKETYYKANETYYKAKETYYKAKEAYTSIPEGGNHDSARACAYQPVS